MLSRHKIGLGLALEHGTVCRLGLSREMSICEKYFPWQYVIHIFNVQDSPWCLKIILNSCMARFVYHGHIYNVRCLNFFIYPASITEIRRGIMCGLALLQPILLWVFLYLVYNSSYYTKWLIIVFLIPKHTLGLVGGCIVWWRTMTVPLRWGWTWHNHHGHNSHYIMLLLRGKALNLTSSSSPYILCTRSRECN